MRDGEVGSYGLRVEADNPATRFAVLSDVILLLGLGGTAVEV